jgi:hypothetical protein
MNKYIILILLIITPFSLAVGKDYDITILNPLDSLNRHDGTASTNLVGKGIAEIFGEISEVRLDPIWNNKGAPVAKAEIENIKKQVRERIDKAKCVGRQSEKQRSMAFWVHGYVLFKNGRIVPIQIMIGGIIVGNAPDDLLFGENEANLVRKTGMLPQSEAQQQAVVGADVGVPGGKQASLELIQDGRRTQQIVVIYPKDMAVPTETNRLIEVQGVIHKFETTKGNAPNNKIQYEALTVTSWKYIEKEITQPIVGGDRENPSPR